MIRKAAEIAQKRANKVTLANTAHDTKELAETERYWEEGGFPKDGSPADTSLSRRIKRLERLAAQAQRTEESNGALANHLWAAAQALKNAQGNVVEDAE